MRNIAIFLVKIYQQIGGFMHPPCCRFFPSCSDYAIQSFQKHGLFKGSVLAVKRVCRCHPFSCGGYDPP